MITESQILEELKSINKQLSRQHQGPLRNFVNGFMHSIGYFIGTISIFILLAIYASRFNWSLIISQSVEKMMSGINWSKVVPMPNNLPQQ